MKEKIKEFLLNILFPKFCLFCKKEGSFLCEDCFSFFDIATTHSFFRGKYLDDLYFSTNYNFFVKQLVQKFKYPPLLKELANELALLILTHLQLLEKKPNFSDYVIIPVPLTSKKKRWRGFNQSEEIAKKISEFLKIPLVLDCLIKIKETKNQVDLKEKERRKNLKNAFKIKNKDKILNRKILLIDDIFTTGSTLEECAKELKKSGVKEVIGMVVARAMVGSDKPDLF